MKRRSSVSSRYRIASVCLVTGYTKNRGSSRHGCQTYISAVSSFDVCANIDRLALLGSALADGRAMATMAADCSRKSLSRQTRINGGPNGYKLI